jgi:hypothetical protein
MSNTDKKAHIADIIKSLEQSCIRYDMPFVCCVQTDIDGEKVLHTAAAYVETDWPTSETVCAMYDELQKIMP